jgi:hypothetical protein
MREVMQLVSDKCSLQPSNLNSVATLCPLLVCLTQPLNRENIQPNGSWYN